MTDTIQERLRKYSKLISDQMSTIFPVSWSALMI